MGDDDGGEDYDKKKYRKTGASNHVGPVKVQPPFINPMIEILVAAKVFPSTILPATIIIILKTNASPSSLLKFL